MVFVLKPGLQTTIQDLGRPGLGDQGISPAGPMDALSFRLGNLIVGNPPHAAALEMTLIGPTLAFETEAVIVLAGAPFEAFLIPRPTLLPAGDLTPQPSFSALRTSSSLVGKEERSDLTPRPPSLAGKGESERSCPPPLPGEGQGERSDLTPQPPFLRGKGGSDSPPLPGEGPGERSDSPPFLGEGPGERSLSPLPLWQAVQVRPGDILKIGAASAGCRGYLCVAGGFEAPVIFGSRATHLMAGLGGLDGRALKTGDRLAVGQPSAPLSRLAGRRLKQTARPTFENNATVRVVLGPQLDRFTQEAQATFLSQPYTVSTDSNRMGVRLTGPVLAHTQGADLLSEGIGLGAIQVPQNGQPIILMVDRQTTGGYTKIATVISADIRQVGQARPGSRLRFQAVTVEAAVAELQRQEALVDETFIERGETWGVAEVTALIQAFTASGLAEMEFEAGGVRLVLRRESGEKGREGERGKGREGERETGRKGERERGRQGDRETGRQGDRETGRQGERGTGSGGGEGVGGRVTAPLLGIFYAAPSPDAPPFVHPGDEVEAGQVVALIDVMKTLHQVHAPEAGVIEAVLVENGTLVEYGQTLMTLSPIG